MTRMAVRRQLLATATAVPAEDGEAYVFGTAGPAACRLR